MKKNVEEKLINAQNASFRSLVAAENNATENNAGEINVANNNMKTVGKFKTIKTN